MCRYANGGGFYKIMEVFKIFKTVCKQKCLYKFLFVQAGIDEWLNMNFFAE